MPKKYLSALFVIAMLTSCQQKKQEEKLYFKKLSKDSVENLHLVRILRSRNKDSIISCADADFKRGKYYYYYTGLGVDNSDYFKEYARKRYRLILIFQGDVEFPSITCYNDAMTGFLRSIKMKPISVIYNEAQREYNKTHTVSK